MTQAVKWVGPWASFIHENSAPPTVFKGCWPWCEAFYRLVTHIPTGDFPNQSGCDPTPEDMELV